MMAASRHLFAMKSRKYAASSDSTHLFPMMIPMTKMRNSGIAIPHKLPSVAVLEMTCKCNQTCLFCSCPWYAPGFYCSDELSPERWMQVIDSLVSRGVTQIAFTGGECLLKPGLKEILDFAASLTVDRIFPGTSDASSQKLVITLLSNGRCMTEEWLTDIAKHGIQLSMSLPGLDKFDELTGNDTGPDPVLEWFRRAKTYGIRTNVGITVTNRNLFELYETIAESLIAGADTILLNRFLPGGRGLQHRDLELDAAGIEEMLDVAESALRQAGRFGSVGTELPVCVVGDINRFERLKVSTTCGAAQGFFVIGADGGIRTCNHSPVVCGNVDRLDEVTTDPYWRRFAGRDYLPVSCRTCGDSVRCDGGCREAAHIVAGRIDSSDSVLA